MQLTHTLIFRKFVLQFADKRLFKLFFGFFILNRRGVRVVEGARLESVYTPKGYRGFESPSLRKSKMPGKAGYFILKKSPNVV